MTSRAKSSMLRRARSREAPGGDGRGDDVVGGDPVEGALDGGGDFVGRAGDEAGAEVLVGVVQELAERVLLAEVGGVVVPLAVGVAEVALVRA